MNVYFSYIFIVTAKYNYYNYLIIYLLIFFQLHNGVEPILLQTTEVF